jgi:PAS domain S-box-containing protein
MLRTIAPLAAFLVLTVVAAGAAWAADGTHAHPAHPADNAAATKSFFSDLFKVYVPRHVCMNGERPVISLHLIADLLIALAYYSIPVALVYFVRRRRDLRFNWVFWMFAAFITACGTTHLFNVWAIWQPLYRLDGVVKVATGALSVATAMALWPLIPKALALPSTTQLEGRVAERTAELGAANESLRREMAARAEAEAARSRLAAIVENSDDAIIGVTLIGEITSWNKGAARIFGYAAAEAVGQSILTLVPPERHNEEQDILGRIGRGELIEHYETVRVTKDGRRRDISLTVSPVLDGAGRVVGASKIARDITDRKQTERERERLLGIERAARAEAEHVSRMKDEFLATLSHELRTPLNAIYGWAQMLRRQTPPPGTNGDLAEGLEVIERNARAQTLLIEDLLDVSRIVSGKVRLDVRPTDLPTLLAEVVKSTEPAAAGKEIRVRTVADPLAGPVSADPDRLRQVLWNLLTNAIKFTPKGGHVDVTLRRVASHVEAVVSDNGQGIAPQLLPHVFERFRQGDSSSTRRHGGLGLGLAIVKHLVELHGGSVTARSHGEGQGSTFTVTLPIRATVGDAEPARAPAGATPARPGDAAGDLPSLAGLRVLVVDDEPDARDLVRRLLEGAGAEVTTAASAADAVQRLSDATRSGRPPQVIVSDIGMPDEDGYALIRRVRQLPPDAGGDIPAAALTAFARSEDRTRAMLAGFQSHVAKPVEPGELVAVVASLAGVVG